MTSAITGRTGTPAITVTGTAIGRCIATATATATTGAAVTIRAGTATTKSTGAEAGRGRAAQPLTGTPTGQAKKVRPGLWPTPQAPLSR